MIVILPAIVLTAAGLLLLLLRLFGLKRDGAALTLALGGLAAAAVTLAVTRPDRWGLPYYDGTVTLDPAGFFLQFVVFAATALCLLLSWDYLRDGGWGMTEYAAVMLLGAVGMVFLIISTDLLSLYVGLETMALASYVLAGYARGEGRSFEAALKYFVLGAFSSAVLLYGISLLYGATGTLNLLEIAGRLSSPPGKLALAGMVLVACGMLFKVAAVPFHLWTPDVYQGAPTPVTAFFSIGPKAAAFAAFLRIFSSAFGATAREWSLLLGLACVLTMVAGNLMAIVQDNVKRMLAYSSIGSAGYVLLGLVAQNAWGSAGVMYYLFAYLFAITGAFGVVLFLRAKEYGGERVDDFKGLSRRHPWVAFAMLVFLLSLIGMPGTAGFVGKFFLFGGAIQGGLVVPAVIGILTSAVSAWYFFRIIVNMYITPETPEMERRTFPVILAVGLCVTGTILFGLWPAVARFLLAQPLLAK